MASIKLICSQCKNSFNKEVKEYNRFIKKDRNKFYCSQICYKKSRINPFFPFDVIFKSVEKTSKYRNKDFNLDIDYLIHLYKKQNGKCAYTNINMELIGDRKHSLYSASLDRIDSSMGYIKGNVEFVCLFINYGKNGFLKEDVIKFLADVRR